MDLTSRDCIDSLAVAGGHIPGMADTPAFTVIAPTPSAIPVLIAVPHAGRCYPANLLDRMRNPGFATLRLEDRYADRLAVAVARATGAALLVAHAPRAIIDLNRAEDDIDWTMFSGAAPSDSGAIVPGRRSRSGLGLIPGRLSGLGDIWKVPHEQFEIEQRLEAIHRPYHRQLEAVMNDLRARWGAALLLDLHSMPTLPMIGGQKPAELVIGDRFGGSCDGALIATCFAYLGSAGRRTAHNRPYAGGYALDRHSRLAENFHAIQIELDRASYLNHSLTEPGSGFESMVSLLIGLVRKLACGMGGLGNAHSQTGLAQAAE
jgi:N-formylglutamate amidohydrolase